MMSKAKMIMESGQIKAGFISGFSVGAVAMSTWNRIKAKKEQAKQELEQAQRKEAKYLRRERDAYVDYKWKIKKQEGKQNKRTEAGKPIGGWKKNVGISSGGKVGAAKDKSNAGVSGGKDEQIGGWKKNVGISSGGKEAPAKDNGGDGEPKKLF